MNPVHPDPGLDEVTVYVFLPSQLEPKKFVWPLTHLIGTAAQQVAEECGIDITDPTFQTKADVVLQQDLTFKAAGVLSGDQLELVSFGGGVLGLVPAEVIQKRVASELPPLIRYAAARGWSVEWRPDDFLLVLSGSHPKTKTPLRLEADLQDYRAVPPAWRAFVGAGDGSFRSCKIKGGGLAKGRSSIFHNACTICAPFNRSAFKELGGPHADWGRTTGWLDARDGTMATATSLDAMFRVIYVHLLHSPGVS